MDGLVTGEGPIGDGPNSGKMLSELLRDRTRALHVMAERSGIIGEILRGGGTRHGYGLLLGNLLPAYWELERGLDRHIGSPLIGPFANPSLYRANAIESDLVAMAGPKWREVFALLPEGSQYAERIAAVAVGDGVRLIAHAYLRYLGDLSGGQIMRRLLAKSLNLDECALRLMISPAFRTPQRSRRSFETRWTGALRETTLIKSSMRQFGRSNSTLPCQRRYIPRRWDPLIDPLSALHARLRSPAVRPSA